ncbi:MAG: hypothetical protein ACTHOM_00140 [Allomuricauda sp.]
MSDSSNFLMVKTLLLFSSSAAPTSMVSPNSLSSSGIMGAADMASISNNDIKGNRNIFTNSINLN